MTVIKFVDELPPHEGKKATHTDYAALRERRDTWAEIERYPLNRKGTAYSRGSATCRRHSDIEYAVRRIGNEIVLFMRAVSQ